MAYIFSRPSLIIKNISTKTITVFGLIDIKKNEQVDLFDKLQPDQIDDATILKALEGPSGSLYKQVETFGNLQIISKSLSTDKNIAEFCYPEVTEIASSEEVVLDFNADNAGYLRMSLTDDVTFSTINLRSGTELCIRLDAEGADRALAFPVGWKFLGAVAPTSLASGKSAMLSLAAFGVLDSDVLAGYSAEQ